MVRLVDHDADDPHHHHGEEEDRGERERHDEQRRHEHGRHDHLGAGADVPPAQGEFQRLETELADIQKSLAEERRVKYTFSNFIGTSPPAMEVKRQARRAAQLESPVLLLGSLAALTYWLDAQVQQQQARRDGGGARAAAAMEGDLRRGPGLRAGRHGR